MKESLRILLVEDNPPDASMVQRYLQQAERFEIDLEHSTSHEEAVGELERTSFDVILLDYKLPGKSGLNTLRFLSDRNVNTPVIVLTGKGDEQSAIEAFRLGACDYIPKRSLSPSVLKEAIHEGLDQSKQQRQRERQIEALKTEVQRDDLTSLLNRRAFRRRLKEETKRAGRYQNPLSLMMIDLDNFKSINDEHGHVVGDRVLKYVARRIRNLLRDTDVAGRYGGDEFCIIVTETDFKGATDLAQRLQDNLLVSFEWDADNEISLTCSIGITQFKQDDNDIEDFIERADQAMYRAKENGGGRIEESPSM